MILRSIGIAICMAAALSGQSAISISTGSLPAGAVGKLYQAGLSVSGGVGPYTWSGTGNFPPGLSVNAGGSIVGTPTTTGTFTFTVNVIDFRQATASKSLSITIGGPQLLITSGSPLTSGVVGQNYNQTLTATGGTPPYQWAVGPGFPSGLTIDPGTGAITGSPAAAGSFTFSVLVADSTQATATANFVLTVNSPPLTITTVSPLFNGAVGVSYAQTFSAAGGKTPYTWTILSGSTGGLTLDAASGALQGTPQTAGTFSFVIQVADSSGAKASQGFALTIAVPALTITAGPPLPNGAAGVAYSQKVSVSASGGTAPYTWSLAGGSVPGLNFDAVNLAFSGTPTTAGTFNLTLQVKDSTGRTATKSFTITITPAALTITTARQLTDGALSAPYSQAFAASGGTPPYSWSAAGLPGGLTIDPRTGVVSGTPTTAGLFNPVVITVADSSLNHFSDNFTLNVSLPAAPPATISGLPATANAAQQFPLQVSLGSAYPAPITGQAVLTFSPDTGLGDNTIQFSSGGTTAAFTVPAGSTDAVFTTPLAIQTGTASGVITVSLRLQSGGIDITPTPAPAASVQIGRSAPVITNTQVSRTSNSISIAVTGYSAAREVTQAVFTFKPASNQTLQSTASSVTVDVTALFSGLFTSSSQGSLFVFTQPFTVQGDPNGVIPVSVTLTNRVGSTTANIAQ